MKFNKIVVEDFGPYRGRNEIELSTEPGKPIILFGGKNGAGKTTLFEAIRYCLHGRSALGRRVAMSDYYSKIRSRLHEYPDGKSETASVRLEFEYAHLGDVDHYSVERKWRDRGKSIVENLEMRRNGKIPNELDEDQWEDFLQQLVPPGVSQLFFFDGEKIQELATAVESDNSFADSMQSLLGLELVERLGTDLSIYVSRKLDESGVEGINQDIKELEKERDEIQSKLDDLREDREEKQNNLDDIEDQIQSIESKIASEGGSYAKRRDELKERRAELNARIQKNEEEVEEIVTGSFPFTLAPDLCNRVVERLQRETEQQDRETAKEELSDELDDVLEDKDIWSDIPTDEIDVDELTHQIKSKLASRFESGTEEPKLAHQFSRSQRQEIYSVVDRALHDIPQEFAVISKKIEADTRELQKVESSLGKAPDEEVISPLFEEVSELNERKGNVKSKIEDLDSKISSAETNLERAENRIQNKLEEKSRLKDVSQRANLATDVKKVVEDYRDELAKEKLRELEDVLSKHYITLSNKSQFYEEIKIDEDTLDISVITIHGTKKSHNELSAGERQIFATSLLWALAEISGRPLPFIIDTPLGRLDQNHRDNLITKFFPEAAHQVLIFSTDTEIDEDQYNKLVNSVSRVYHLEYDESEGITQPSKGYFWTEDDGDQLELEEVTS